MERRQPMPSPSFGKEPSGGLRENLAQAARFWERGRLLYNLILTAFVIGWVVTTWPHFRVPLAVRLDLLLLLAVLGLLANACYSAAYLVDIAMQRSSRDTFWGAFWGADWGAELGRRRWGLWLVGTAFAIVLENYWIADEVYPFVP